MLADGYDIVLDLEKSQRAPALRRASSDRWFLDMFSFFATLPVGLNHPKMREPEFLAQLQRAALANPTNSDVYTVEMAEFVETFGRLAMPDYLPHLFFVAGGALGVENALKAAFDWKVRRNFRKGTARRRGIRCSTSARRSTAARATRSRSRTPPTRGSTSTSRSSTGRA